MWFDIVAHVYGPKEKGAKPLFFDGFMGYKYITRGVQISDLNRFRLVELIRIFFIHQFDYDLNF